MTSQTQTPAARIETISSGRHGDEIFELAEPQLKAERTHRADIGQEANGEVVRLAGKGDQEAWAELVRRFGGLVHRVARRNGLAASDAADVAQVTWQQLAANIDRIRDPSRIAGWLATTARRESLRLAINATREIPSADPIADPVKHNQITPGADFDLLRGSYHPTIEKALGRLPTQYPKLLGLLSSDAGLSYAQIATILGISIGSIGPMRQRALNVLRHDAQLANSPLDQ